MHQGFQVSVDFVQGEGWGDLAPGESSGSIPAEPREGVPGTPWSQKKSVLRALCRKRTFLHVFLSFFGRKHLRRRFWVIFCCPPPKRISGASHWVGGSSPPLPPQSPECPAGSCTKEPPQTPLPSGGSDQRRRFFPKAVKRPEGLPAHPPAAASSSATGHPLWVQWATVGCQFYSPQANCTGVTSENGGMQHEVALSANPQCHAPACCLMTTSMDMDKVVFSEVPLHSAGIIPDDTTCCSMHTWGVVLVARLG